MTNRFFILERDGEFTDDILFTDDDGNILFEDILELSKEEAHNNTSLEFQQFVIEASLAADEYFTTSGTTLLAAVEENVGIVWCIIIEKIDDEKIRYVSAEI